MAKMWNQVEFVKSEPVKYISRAIPRFMREVDRFSILKELIE